MCVVILEVVMVVVVVVCLCMGVVRACVFGVGSVCVRCCVCARVCMCCLHRHCVGLSMQKSSRRPRSSYLPTKSRQGKATVRASQNWCESM